MEMRRMSALRCLSVMHCDVGPQLLTHTADGLPTGNTWVIAD